MSVDLLAAWERAVTADGGRLIDGLAALTAATGVEYDHTYLSQWRLGRRPMPEPVQRHMRSVVLPAALQAAGIDVERVDLSALAAALTPPERRAGRGG